MDVNSGCSPTGSPVLGVTDPGGSVTFPCLHAKLDTFIHSLTHSFIHWRRRQLPSSGSRGAPSSPTLCWREGTSTEVKGVSTLPHFGTSGPVSILHKGTRLWGHDVSAAGAEQKLPVRSWARSPQGSGQCIQDSSPPGGPEPRNRWGPGSGCKASLPTATQHPTMQRVQWHPGSELTQEKPLEGGRKPGPTSLTALALSTTP